MMRQRRRFFSTNLAAHRIFFLPTSYVLRPTSSSHLPLLYAGDLKSVYPVTWLWYMLSYWSHHVSTSVNFVAELG